MFLLGGIKLWSRNERCYRFFSAIIPRRLDDFFVYILLKRFKGARYQYLVPLNILNIILLY